MFLRQSTAQTIRFGPCLDKTDGVTEETALTLAQADMRLSKDGGAFAQKNAVGNATHDSDGWYSTSLNATDTGTVGELILNVHQPANMLPVWMRFYVVEEAVYDALFAAAAAGPLQSTVAGRTLDVTATGAAGIDWGNVENPATIVDLSATDIQLCDTVTTNTDMRGTDSAATAAALATVDANVDAILVDTGTDIPARFDGIEGATFTTGTDSLEALRNRGDAAWITGSGTGLTPLASGTAQSGSASTIQLAAGETFADNELNGNVAKIVSGTGAGQSRLITGYVGATDTATVAPNWVTAPDATSVYEIVDGPATIANMEADVVTATAVTAGALNGKGDWNIGKTGYSLTTAANNAAADALLKRDWNSVSGEAARSALNALRFLRNKWSVAGVTLTVTTEDDVTTAWTATVSTDAAADPITGNDPA